jgi:hypothetical protein
VLLSAINLNKHKVSAITYLLVFIVVLASLLFVNTIAYTR